jgi:exodeoxyribonuclease VII large subunit
MAPTDPMLFPEDRPPEPGTERHPLSVGEFIRITSRILDRQIGTVWIDGEVASLQRAGSGHLYFCLKDGNAQVRAVMWRSDAQRLKFTMEDGQHLLCRGRPGLYERDGKFQLYVSTAHPAGVGADAVAFEQLKAKLLAEGLFDSERKRPLPRMPRRIGVVTSRHGAALRDIVRAVERRYPTPILVADAQVQGSSAPRQLVAALEALWSTDCDLIIIGRGGGSASDLVAFNSEMVVRALARSPIPTISAVGHEVDLTLTDLVADRRAATPTMAAEMAVPVWHELREDIDELGRRLFREWLMVLNHSKQDLDRLRLSLASRMDSAMGQRRNALTELRRKLETCHPRVRLKTAHNEMRELRTALDALMRKRLHVAGRNLGDCIGRLEALSPLSVLQRGYALATKEGHVIADATQVDAGDDIDVRLARGRLACRVTGVTK